MENTETHYEMQVRMEGSSSSWNERMQGLTTADADYNEPKTDEEALLQAELTIKFFNDTLKPDETPRLLQSVQRIETKVIDIMEPVFNEKSVCPECLNKVDQTELDMFGGLCEECNLEMNEDE